MINIPAKIVYIIPALEIALGVFLIVWRIKRRRKRKNES